MAKEQDTKGAGRHGGRRGGGQGGGDFEKGRESKKSGEILGSGQGGPSRSASGSESEGSHSASSGSSRGSQEGGGGPSRHSSEGTQSEQSRKSEGLSGSIGKTGEDKVLDSDFSESRGAKGSSARELGEGGESEGRESKKGMEEDIDVSMGKGEHGQSGQGREAPGAGA